MKFSIDPDLISFAIRDGSGKETCLKLFVLLKSAVAHLLSSFGVRWGVAGVCTQQLMLLIKDLELLNVAHPLL